MNWEELKADVNGGVQSMFRPQEGDVAQRQTNLQGSCHEHRAAHEQKDDQARQPLLPDAQETGLLSRSRALRLQLQAVDMRDGQNRGCHEPRQPHDGADRQHHPDHQQVQVVPATLLRDRMMNY